MPVDDFLKNYKPGDDFTFEKFRDEVNAEYEKDQTAWRAAVTTRDEKITTTESDLLKAQAAAWQARNSAPVTDQTVPDEPDENSQEAIRARIFQPYNRK